MSIAATRLGCATVTLGGLLPDKLRAIRDAGFAATEILARDIYESLGGAEVAVAAFRESRLRAACFQLLRDQEGAPQEQRSLKRLIAENVIAQMPWVDAGTLIVGSNVDPASSGDKGRMRDDLYELGELARSKNVRIAYEALCWGRWVRDYRDAWALIQQVNHPNVGLMLDSAHIGGIGADFAAVDDIDPAKIFLVEINDLPRMQIAEIDVSRFYRLMPGEGVLDLPDFIRRLEKIGYSGDYSLEVFNDHYRSLPSADVARHAFQCVSRLMASCGS